MATIDSNALNRLVGRLLSHTDTLAGWANLPPDIVRDVHAATCILDEVTELMDTVERMTSPRAVAATILGLNTEVQ
jgi:hypothetical protein